MHSHVNKPSQFVFDKGLDGTLSVNSKRFQNLQGNSRFLQESFCPDDVGQQVSGRDGDTAPRQPLSLASTSAKLCSPSFPSPAFHSTPVPRPGLWEDSEGTGSGLAFRVSRNHKVGQRQKQFLGSPQKTRCDEAAVNTSDFNSSATGMKLKNATQIGGATQNCDLCT